MLTHSNEELDHGRFRDPPVFTPRAFLEFELIDRYPTFFHMVHVCRMQGGDNEFQVWDCPGKPRNTAVASYIKSCNHWCGCDALDCCCVGIQMDS